MTQRYLSPFNLNCWTPFRIGDSPEVYDKEGKDLSFIGWIRPNDKIDGKFYSNEIEAGRNSIKVWINEGLLEYILDYLYFCELRSHSVAKFPYDNDESFSSKWEIFARIYHAERFK